MTAGLRADEGRGGVRVLGVDPGLTRCGVGVVEGVAGRPLTMVGVGVVRTPADAEIGPAAGRHRAGHRAVARRAPARSRRRGAGVQPAQRPHGDGHRPGQRGRHALRRPPRACPSPCTPPARSRPPSPAAAGPTRRRSARWSPGCCGSTRRPSPADAADALALAICHIWRAPAQNRLQQAVAQPAAGRPRAAPHARTPLRTERPSR